MKNRSVTLIAVCLCLLSATAVVASDLKMWYDKPASNWMREALPIGNGRLGGMIFGDMAKEHIQFNEDSLWIGDESDTGAYQAFGDLFIELSDPGSHSKDTGGSYRSKSSQYRRELDLAKGIHTITYKEKVVNFKREYFASYPDQVLVFRRIGRGVPQLGIRRLVLVDQGRLVAAASPERYQQAQAKQKNALQESHSMEYSFYFRVGRK